VTEIQELSARIVASTILTAFAILPFVGMHGQNHGQDQRENPNELF
jgi:hypothetical protein